MHDGWWRVVFHLSGKRQVKGEYDDKHYDGYVPRRFAFSTPAHGEENAEEYTECSQKYFEVNIHLV